MVARKPRPSTHTTPADTTTAVDAFLADLDHPAKALIQSVRRVILAADARIAEGVKWNAPSFRAAEYFATTHLREKRGVGIILHLGAKARDLGDVGLAIPDPAHLLEWLAPDRARVVFTDARDLAAKKSAFQAILRSWLTHVA